MAMGIPIPSGGRNVVTNTVLPRFFAQKVVTKVVTFFRRGRNILKVTGDEWRVSRGENRFQRKDAENIDQMVLFSTFKSRFRHLACLLLFNSCCQILTTLHPCFLKVRFTRRSRLIFRASFCFQNSAFATGLVRCLGQLCQKQPSTKRANLC
jgi:hypothetical protein